jgi:hypothetical protein
MHIVDVKVKKVETFKNVFFSAIFRERERERASESESERERERREEL